MFFDNVNESKDLQNEKIQKIERYAEKLISASLSEAKWTSCKEKMDKNKENID